ncbi:MAG: ribonuclease HI family protein [Candidatus Omnitrophota bacterium]
MKHLNLFVDGGSRGNPGPAGIGIVIKDADGRTVRELSRHIGIATNNIAEYYAVIYGLQEALFEKADEVDLHIDSELVAQQLKGDYRVRNANIKPLFDQTLHLIGGFKNVRIHGIPREKNKEADKLVNKALNLADLF